MRNTQKTISCVECGAEVKGNSNMDVLRSEMDHVRINHPELYQKMMSEVSLRTLFNWMLTQIQGRSPRTA
ncbi:MAG: hypothetical protein M3Q73_01345 [bacterium]|nr:hypothetical protein [bacterium]